MIMARAIMSIPLPPLRPPRPLPPCIVDPPPSTVSNNSHLIMSVNVDGVNRHTGAATAGRLHLIDLAGSERISKVRENREKCTCSL